MRFPQAAHMPDDGHGDHSAPAHSSSGSTDTPVWARRSGRSGGGGGIFTLIFVLLALVGALSIGLAIYDKSFAAGGARIDGWIKPATDQIAKMTGKAGAKAEDAAGDPAAAAGDAAETAGDAAQAAGNAAADAAAPAPAAAPAAAPAKK